MRKLATQASGLLSDEMEELLARLERTPEPVHARTGPVAKEGQALRTILVPLDGSPFAEQALACAEALAEATGYHLVLTRTTQALPDREAEAYLRTVAAGLAKRVSVETAILGVLMSAPSSRSSRAATRTSWSWPPRAHGTAAGSTATQ